MTNLAGMAAKTPTLAEAKPPESEEHNTAAVLLQLEREARHADSRAPLFYLMVNRTRRLIGYRQSIVVEQLAKDSFKVRAVSNVAVVEANAPYVIWLRRLLKHLARAGALEKAGRLEQLDELSEADIEGWDKWWTKEVYWQPLRRGNGQRLGGMIFVRDAPPWIEIEQILIDEIADCYGHAWSALKPKKGINRNKRRLILAIAFLTTLALMVVPVRQSSISPARIGAATPLSVAAPINGVLAEVLVKPNQSVVEGQPLVRYEAAELEANYLVSQRSLDAAEADLRRVQQQAFADIKSKAEIALKEAEVALKKAELDYARYLLDRVVVTSPADGVAVFSDANALRGRPIRVGERMMEVADPNDVGIKIDIPVANAISLSPGSEVLMFLDVDPLNPVRGELQRTAFEAEQTVEGVLAYRATATLVRDEDDGDAPPPRIGLSGSAKVYGERVPMAMFLFRRPISAFRQMVGF